MAFVGPEGPCYFDRDLLHTDQWHGGSNINDFKDYLLHEVVVNKSFDEGNQTRGDPDLPETGTRRAEKQVIAYSNRRYARWRDLHCSYGPSSTDIRRADVIHGNGDGRNLAQWVGHTQVAYIPIRMPTPEERFMWVDLTYPIRGIYLPSSYAAFAQEKYRKWARYVFVKFNQNDVKLKTYTRYNDPSLLAGFNYAAASLFKGSNSKPKPATVPEPDAPPSKVPTPFALEFTVGELEVKQDDKYGLSFQPTWTARFDIKQLELALHVPMERRAPEFKETYDFIALFDSKHVDTIDWWEKNKRREIEMGDGTYIKLADAVSKHEGIKMKEEKTEADEDWLKNIVTSLIQAGLGLIPYVGPFLSMGFEAVSEYLDDPEEWGKKEGLKLSTEATAEMAKSATEILKFYKKGKVPNIRIKAHLEEGDDEDRKPVYVGEDGGQAQGPGNETKPKTGESQSNAEAVVITVDDEDTYWGKQGEVVRKT
ncbi:uncharacterized protein BDV14DRAFT_202207 [Aspergillus stella-maris]|uniref:uncharacterized protein n=1 Tax=Aspergillus stella-maris TaxID=1810926 RepID=UPI003CCCADCE